MAKVAIYCRVDHGSVAYGQFAIEQQKRQLERYAKNNGVTVYFDCWAGNDFLKKFYSENGFEYMGDFPEEDYYVSAFKSR